MKPNTILLVASLSAFSVSAAMAAEEPATDVKAGGADVVQAKKVEAKQPVQRHSHMQEKTGMPMSRSTADMGKHEPVKLAKNRHDRMKEK